ncbi:MAG: trypsin-like peptidase domain-containing protein [Candidatus Scalindua rubra]|nr:trypsin-like peptidase domain-containing protein [Candidatus Scalindua rubra]
MNFRYLKFTSLNRNLSTVTRNERVDIIQHPKELPKKVTLHDNKVILIKDKVVHYQTDTEPGSSGSPVFNNKWDLVTLHHAGWSVGASRSTNEGVQISVIVSHLLRQSD